jgi:hypothetical protein
VSRTDYTNRFAILYALVPLELPTVFLRVSIRQRNHPIVYYKLCWCFHLSFPLVESPPPVTYYQIQLPHSEPDGGKVLIPSIRHNWPLLLRLVRQVCADRSALGANPHAWLVGRRVLLSFSAGDAVSFNFHIVPVVTIVRCV